MLNLDTRALIHAVAGKLTTRETQLPLVQILRMPRFLVHPVPLVTRDKKLRRSSLVPLA